MDAFRLDQLFADARTRLRAAGVDTPELDARLLVEWATGTTRLHLISTPEMVIPSEIADKLGSILARRVAGEPVHRIIGSRAFYGLQFRLSAETLEPRPDTEALIDLVVPHLEKMVEANGIADILDMGTGTGAIAITLATRFERLRAVGVDIAPGALATARLNAHDTDVSSRFAALQSDWYANVRGRFDLIVSNPPYIPHHDIAELSREVREHDPLAALDGGSDGLDFYRALALGASDYLYKGGMIAVEIGAGQADDVERIFAQSDYQLKEVASDLGGHKRALLFVAKSAETRPGI